MKLLRLGDRANAEEDIDEVVEVVVLKGDVANAEEDIDEVVEVNVLKVKEPMARKILMNLLRLLF